MADDKRGCPAQRRSHSLTASLLGVAFFLLLAVAFPQTGFAQENGGKTDKPAGETGAGDGDSPKKPKDSPGDKEGGPAEPKADESTLPKRFGLTWFTPEAGLKKAAKERRLAVIVVPGAEGGHFWSELETRLFGHKSVLKIAKEVVLIDASPDHPGLGLIERTAGSLQNKQLVLFFDFEQHLLARFKDEAPTRTKFTRSAKAALKTNQTLAELHRRVLQSLEKSRYALKLKRYKEAVLHLLAAKRKELPQKSSLMQRTRDVQEEIDKVYYKREDEAQALEDDKLYAQAIEKYEVMLKDFPFPERQKELRRRITHLYNLIQQP